MKYSQNNEQEIILKYFGGYFVGTFLDIGANDGVTFSNSYALSKGGWSGVCVEASPKAYNRLLKAHPFTRDIEYYNIALADYNGTIVLYESGEHIGKGDVALLSSTKQSEVDRWAGHRFTPVAVECITFDNLLALSVYKQFHFITLDIEGMELDVLPQLDLKALGCEMICVEFNGKEKQAYNNIIVPQGFKLIHQNGENLIYTR